MVTLGCGRSLADTDAVSTSRHHNDGYYDASGHHVNPKGFWGNSQATCGMPNTGDDWSASSTDSQDIVLCMRCARKLGVIW